jgi:hypothetical protein
MKIIHLALLGFVLLLAGCASSVRQPIGSETRQYLGSLKAREVTVRLSEAAQKKAAEHPNFKAEDVRDAITRELDTKQLLAKDSSHVVEVVITNMNIRATLTAVVLGPIAGDDNVTANVTLKDAAGRVLNQSEVTASASMGMGASGLDDIRLRLLYGSLAQLAVQDLSEPK